MDTVTIKKDSLWYLLGLLLAAGGLTYIIAKGFFVVLLTCVALLFAVLLYGLSDQLATRTGVSYRTSLGVVLMGLLAAIALFFTYLIPQLESELQNVGQVFSGEAGSIERYLDRIPFLGDVDLNLSAQSVRTYLEEHAQLVATQLGDVFSRTANVLFYGFFIIAVGTYVAYNPSVYRHGTLFLLPADRRERALRDVREAVTTLKWWLLGRLMSMLVVAALTFVMLLLLGVPLAFSLSLLAGLLSFIPNLGPILSLLPAILVALTVSAATAAYVIIAYGAIQLIESYFITPYIEKRMVRIPPAFLLFLQVLLGVVFGALGLILAAPFAAVAIALARQWFPRERRVVSSRT